MRVKTTHNTGTILLAAILVFLLQACAVQDKTIGIGAVLPLVGLETEVKDEMIRVGAVLPLIGYGAENGENALKGYQLAVEEINQKGGLLDKTLELVVADHAGDNTAEALSAYRSLKVHDINLMLGPNYSPLGQAMAPIACEENTLLISAAIGIRGFVEECDLIFNLRPVDYQNSVLLGETVVKSGGKRIAILGSEQSWEREQAEGVKQGVEQSKGNIVAYIIAQNEPTDFRTEATKIIHAEADSVIFTNHGYMHLAAKRLRELGSTAKFYVVILDETKKDGAQGAFENTVIITSLTPTQEFIEKFESKYNKKPDFPADSSYDALMLLAQAISNTNSTDPQVLATYLTSLKQYKGASGNLTLTENRGVTKDATFQIVKNNTIIRYEP